jgi:hypothetical protein
MMGARPLAQLCAYIRRLVSRPLSDTATDWQPIVPQAPRAQQPASWQQVDGALLDAEDRHVLDVLRRMRSLQQALHGPGREDNTGP